MPLPKPRKGETKDQFVSRCMSNKTMTKEFPKQEQRVAVCNKQWEDRKRLGMDSAGKFEPVGEKEYLHDLPVQHFKKDLLGKGTYVHPKDKWTLPVNAELLGQLVTSARQFKERGIAIPILKYHSFERDDDADATLGYLDHDLQIVDKWLTGIAEFRGAESIETALKNDQVSVGIQLEWEDTHGNYYPAVIDHVAVTPSPVVPGQKGFEKLETSKGFGFSRLVLDKEDKCMNDKTLQELTELLGEDVTEDTLVEQVRKRLDNDQTTVVASLTAENERLKSLSVPFIDPEALEDRAEVLGDRVDRLVKDAKVSPAFATAFKQLMIGDKGKRFALGLASDGGKKTALTKQLIALIEEHFGARVELGEASMSQTGVLDIKSRDGKDGFDPDIFARMLGDVGIKEIK